MSDKKDGLNRQDVTIGMSPDGEVSVLTIPLKKYADNIEDGAALMFGKFRELEAHVRQEFQQIRLRKSQVGLIKSNGAMPPDLKVN